jgi:hypothetical protein
MECKQVQKRLPGLADGRIVEAERRALQRHLGRCQNCTESAADYRKLRSNLLGLPREEAPVGLKWSLRAMASREAARRRRYAGFAGWLHERRDQALLLFDRLMRPFAVPATAGVFSSLILFTLVMTNFRGIVIAHPNDVPTILSTDAQLLRSAPLSIDSDFVVVDVLVDDQGRVLQYRFPEDLGGFTNKENHKQIERALRLCVFKPATNFGQPVDGWTRVSFATQRSEMEVHD